MIYKRILIASISVCLILVLSACGSKSGDVGTSTSEVPTSTPKANVVVADIADKMFEDIEMLKMIEMEPDLIKERYGLITGDYKQVLILAPMMNVKVDELAFVEVKDASQIETVKAAMKNRADKVADNFKTYLQDQYEIAQKPVIKSNGNYVFMAISPYADKLAAIFDSFTQ
ncbi:DUF4358 domain-containing protein [Paenibacillus albiflavus]|uniref:DUF4358 domain-containing protein n=1 Tax=Paenibacillus albiflavus TaxID=2545760 RepID=A0A4V2WNG9_9BACL|nr:DUF4358 domain-containing protein [Paenibacillus albiflavus]TCZ75432.1 DUF4358 domain-containing protein [Paenibacillus albiflavus]